MTITPPLKLTPAVQRIVASMLAAAADTDWWGTMLAEKSGVSEATCYMVLRAFRRVHWMTMREEPWTPGRYGRARRLYKFTEAGWRDVCVMMQEARRG